MKMSCNIEMIILKLAELENIISSNKIRFTH
jgi:hypothetical protein